LRWIESVAVRQQSSIVICFEAIVKPLTSYWFLPRIADIGLEIFPREQQTPEALRALQRAEIEKWRPIIKAAGIKAE
jgi:hypothetical protein